MGERWQLAMLLLERLSQIQNTSQIKVLSHEITVIATRNNSYCHNYVTAISKESYFFKYTSLPFTIVLNTFTSLIFSGAISKIFSSNTTRSARIPFFSVPNLFSWKPA